MLDCSDPGLSVQLTFDPGVDIAAPYIGGVARPKIAVLREQGVNSQVEMAAALDLAGFEAHDIHMSDLLAGTRSLQEFRGLIACGGFSYGDVLGAGEGWAKSIARRVCAVLRAARHLHAGRLQWLPDDGGTEVAGAGHDHWPRFVRNRGEQFEGRFSLVEILPSPSVLLAGMAGSRLPIAVAHGEGRAEFAEATDEAGLTAANQVAFRYVNGRGEVARTYPANPNGSPAGIAAVTSGDGRVLLTMPHPERSFRVAQNSWHPQTQSPYTGWMRMFRNARLWVNSRPSEPTGVVPC